VVLPNHAREEEPVMPAAPIHALLALSALIDELDTLRTRQARIAELEADVSPRVADARSEALNRLAAADRLELFEAATQALAAACARRELPEPARAAAYSALVGLIANDLVPQATFRTLYESWEAALDGAGVSSVLIRGEEVLLHID
jgi:hypothetical protein